MRLAVVHNHPSGGAARAIHELGKQLARSHTLDVFTLATGDEAFLPSSEYAGHVRVFPYARRRPLRLGLYLNDLRDYQDLQAIDRAYRSMAAAIDDAGYDAVLASACRELQSPGALAHLATPAAYYCHEPPRRLIERDRRPDAGPLPAYRRLRAAWHRPASAALDRARAQCDRRNVAAARVVLTNSSYTAGVIRDYYHRDAVVAHLGVDATRFFAGERSARGYVLSVGAIDRHKGFDFLIDALSRIPPDVRPPLRLVGNYADPAVACELRARAERASVALAMHTGVPDDALAAAYAGASVFAYAAHREPFGLAVLEAMAAALPVVAVREGGVADSIVDGVTGTLVRRDAASFAAALQAMLADGTRAAAFGRAGRETVERVWTWDAAARRVEAALAGVAERAPAGNVA